MGARVKGVNGGGVGMRSSSSGAFASGTLAGGGEGCLSSGAGAALDLRGEATFAAGIAAVDGLCSGLGSERSADVGRRGVLMSSAGGAVTTGVMIGTAVLGCSCSLGGGLGAAIGSKLNGRLCSVGGGRGDKGEMARSLGSAAFRVGEGVISGVSVSTILVGIGGAGRCAYTS